MTWNWQQSDWPKFSWRSPRFDVAEQQFLLAAGTFVGAIRHLRDSERNQLTVQAMSVEAITTSEIEGEILDRASVQSSIQRQLGLAADKRRVGPAETGVSEMMVSLHNTFAQPLSDDMLFGWHRMLMSGRQDVNDVGRYRTSTEPMQIVSGAMGAAKIHFAAPPSKKVPEEMKQFIKWFNRTAPGGQEPLPALTRAGTAHLYFESVHPFEDGNGRIGRALAEKSLAQSLGRPSLIALAATILAHRERYYAALEAANKTNEITEWLAWFAGTTLEAQRHTLAMIEFLIDKTKLFDGIRERLNPRQEKALVRMFKEGPEGFKGGMSAGKYGTITGASPATTTRDLADLTEKGALIREGERRHARYKLSIPLRHVPQISVNKRGELIEE
ncbi:MAG TPA: Fic family protein [Terriglobales bacterium]|nr:Fic family protein [Terriglobales bacterium]